MGRLSDTPPGFCRGCGRVVSGIVDACHRCGVPQSVLDRRGIDHFLRVSVAGNTSHAIRQEQVSVKTGLAVYAVVLAGVYMVLRWLGVL